MCSRGVIIFVICSGLLLCNILSENVISSQQISNKVENISRVKFTLNEAFSTNLQSGRGKLHKKKKIMQIIYPLMLGLMVAKTVLVPLIIKALTAMSTSSFVMSKIALIASGLILIRWILSRNKDKTKVEIVQIPPQKFSQWNNRDVMSYKYIPINGGYYGSNLDPPDKGAPFL